MKKILFGLVTASLFISMFSLSSVSAASSRTTVFTDLALHNRFYESVYSLYLKEVMEGTEHADGVAIEPLKSVTRADAAYMLYHLLGYTYEEGTNFPDVLNNHVAYDAIQTMSAKGVLDGFLDGSFKPNQLLTRAEMSKVIASAFDYQINAESSIPYTDVSKTFKPYVHALYSNGITSGVTATQYASNREISRQEMAAFMDRAYKKVPGSQYNELEVLNAVNEALRKARVITSQGLVKNFPKLQASNVSDDFKEVAVDPFYSWALNNYSSLPCAACDVDIKIRDFDYGLGFTVIQSTNDSIIVNAVAPESYFSNGYRGTIELIRVGDKWKIKSLNKVAFEESPLNLTLDEAKDYLTYALSIYWQQEVNSIKHIGKDSYSDGELFLVNGNTTYSFDLNNGALHQR
ncbi:MAG: S-layer homology domain-containing protein [Paenisporosarcina sp.]|nr:S-layer homology domain-containing protein [Paenisporosarcina sp.]